MLWWVDHVSQDTVPCVTELSRSPPSLLKVMVPCTPYLLRVAPGNESTFMA
jgi:hypothetical protein